MDVLHTRPVELSDVRAITDILQAAERAEPAQDHVDEEYIGRELTSPAVDLARGSVAVCDGDVVVGCGLLHVSPTTDKWQAHLVGEVDPESRRRGIGRLIVDRMMAAAVSIRDADAPGLPGELKIWVPGPRAGLAVLAAAAGYQPWRYFFDMRREVDNPLPEVAGPAGIELRPLTPADGEDVRLAYNESFSDHWGSVPMDQERWQAMVIDEPSFRPESSVVGMLAGSVVGFVLVEEFDAETAALGYRTAYISRVGTTRAVRGRGLASALLALGLRNIAERGYRYADLTVDGDSPTGANRIYERLGFVTISSNQVYGRTF